MKENQNIDILVEKIISSEKLVQEFSKLDSLDQIYDFCQAIHGGYTKEEFALFIDEIVSSFIEESSVGISLAKGLSDSDIESVSGGAKPDVKRIIAASLASLSFISVPKFNSTYAADPQESSNDTAIIESKKDEETKESVGFWGKAKAKLVAFKDMIARNKGKVTIGALILAAIGFGIYKKEDIKDSWESYKTNKEINKGYKEKIEDIDRDIETVRKLGAGLNAGVNYFNFRYKDEKDKNRIKTIRIDQYSDPGNVNFVLNALEGEKESAKKIINGNSTHFPGISSILKVAGGIGLAGKTVWDLMYRGIGGIGALGRVTSDINGARYSLSNMVQDFEYKMNLENEKNNKKEFNRKEALETLEDGLATVRGQEKAKKGIRGFFNSVTMEKERLKAVEQKDSHAHVVVFNGASGTGKSFTASHLANAISNATPYIMSASEVDVNSSKSSIVGQLFGDSYGGYGRGGQEERKNFVKYIEDHPNDGVVIINEYDKMCVRDSKDHPLDEVMRTFIDEGKATINGKVVDCSGVVFILTTNESDGSLQGKVSIDPLTKKLVDPTVDLDSTGSRTIVKHDKSFLNRLTIVNFDNLSAQEYIQIAKDKFAPTIEFLKTNEGGNIDLSISEESYNKIAKYTERINEGARTIDKVLGELFTAVVEKVSELQAKNEQYIGKKLEAVYDDASNEFKIQ